MDLIRCRTDYKEFLRIVNSCSNKEHGYDRAIKINFCSYSTPTKQHTIEFRQATSTEDTEWTIHWIRTVVGFVWSCEEVTDKQLDEWSTCTTVEQMAWVYRQLRYVPKALILKW